MKKRFLIMLMLSVLLVLACMTSAMAACSATYGEVKCNGSHAEEVQWNPVNHWTIVTHNAGTSSSFQTTENSGEHTWETIIGQKCSLGSRGYYVKRCTVCGYVDNDSKRSHEGMGADRTYIDQDATCGVPGSMHKVCNACGGVTFLVETIPAHGNHDMYVAEERAATCTELSYKLEKCRNCDLKVESVGKVPLGHNTVEVTAQKSNCCYEGWTNLVCSRCGIVQKEKYASIPVSGEHKTQRVTVKEATCTEDGRYEDRCSVSGKVLFAASIPATGHSPASTLGQKPDCCHDGWYMEVCSVCQKTLNAKTDIIPATGKHATTRQETVKAPTCTEKGSYRTLCGTYGTVIRTGSIPMIDHEMIMDKKVPATCTHGSEEHMKCKHCGYTEVTKNNDKLNHVLVKTVDKAATCYDDGYYSTLCKNCDVKYTNVETIPALGHNSQCLDDHINATCTTAGRTEGFVCTRLGCDMYNKIISGHEVIPAKGHKFEQTGIEYATCQQAGYVAYTCYECGDSKKEVLEQKECSSHRCDNYVPATCTKEGRTEEFRCMYCLRLMSGGEVIPALGHKTEKQITFQPTCCDSGWYNEVCTRCGETTAVKLPIAATGNHSEDWRTVEAASCLKGEVLGLFCGNTGKPLNQTKEGKGPLGHFLHNLDDHRAATCTENGQTEGFVCQRQGCPMYNEVVKGHDVIPALGHTKDGYMSVKYAPTCCDSGWYDLLCNRCDATIAVKLPIPATGNHKADWREVEAATCTTKQVLALFCGNTGKPLYEYKDGEGPNGHSWGEWVVVTPATETKEGVKEHTCTACGATEKGVIDKLNGGKDDPTPKPTDDIKPTPKPTVTPTPPVPEDIIIPTTGPCYTPTPVPTGDPAVTATPAPTGDPAVTATPAPTGDPAVTATPAPTGDPAVTATPAPTGDPAVTATPAPTGDPAVTATPAPTGDPAVTATPAPTGDPAGDDDCKHVEEELKGFPPTCTEQGREDGIICGECGEVLEGGEWIDPTGHKPVVIPAVEPTETEKGLTEGLKCETCGKILKEQYPVDFEGNLYNPDDPDGPSIGTEIPKKPGEIYNPEDELIGRLEGDVITDPNGEYIGTVDKDGNIVDENGNVIGKVDEEGKVTDKDGNHMGDVFGYDELEGRDEPGHPNFDLSDYLDEYYTHVEDGDKIRPTIDEDKCTIGTKEKLEGDGITVLIKGAEDYAICPVDKYPMSQWIDLGNGLHKRVCTCLDCDYYEIAACVPFDITVEEVEYHICPICGHFTEEEDYEWIKGVKVGEVGNMNEMIAREKDEPFGTAAVQVKDMDENAVTITESFTAVKSQKGVLMNWFTNETLYIPMVHPGDADLIRMNYDGEFTEVNYVYDNGFVIFNSDEHGLYLFVK